MRILLALLLSCAVASAANVRNYFINPFTGAVDTNALIITRIGTNILSSGGVVGGGLPKKTSFSPYTNLLSVGFYSVSNTYLRTSYVINVNDSGTTLYDYTNLLHSGFNTYVTKSVTSNDVVSALGFVPGTGSGVDATTVAAIMDTNNAATADSATNLYGSARISSLTASAPLSFDLLGGTITSGNSTFGASGFNLTGGGINPSASHSTNFVGNAAGLTNVSAQFDVLGRSLVRLDGPIGTNQPKPFFISADAGYDQDKMETFIWAANMEKAGLIRIIGLTTPIREAANSNSVRCLEAIARNYGIKAPVGVNKEAEGHPITDYYASLIATNYQHSGGPWESSIRRARRALVAEADNSVWFLTTCGAWDLWYLLKSPADDISPLTGEQLTQQKVALWINGAGLAPYGDEYNFGDFSGAAGEAWDWQTNKTVFWVGAQLAYSMTNFSPVVTDWRTKPNVGTMAQFVSANIASPGFQFFDYLTVPLFYPQYGLGTTGYCNALNIEDDLGGSWGTPYWTFSWTNDAAGRQVYWQFNPVYSNAIIELQNRYVFTSPGEAATPFSLIPTFGSKGWRTLDIQLGGISSWQWPSGGNGNPVYVRTPDGSGNAVRAGSTGWLTTTNGNIDFAISAILPTTVTQAVNRIIMCAQVVDNYSMSYYPTAYLATNGTALGSTSLQYYYAPSGTVYTVSWTNTWTGAALNRPKVARMIFGVNSNYNSSTSGRIIWGWEVDVKESNRVE